MNSLKKYYKQSKIEFLFFGLFLIYSLFLTRYNSYLLTKYSQKDYFHMLFENTIQMGMYFLLAIIIIGLSASFIIMRKNKMKKEWLFDEDDNTIIHLISIIINIIIIIMTIIMIYNPILQCILFGILMLYLMVSQ